MSTEIFGLKAGLERIAFVFSRQAEATVYSAAYVAAFQKCGLSLTLDECVTCAKRSGSLALEVFRKGQAQ